MTTRCFDSHWRRSIVWQIKLAFIAHYNIVILTFLSVSVSTFPALTFKSIDLETSFLMWRYIFRICRSSSYIKVIGSRSIILK